MKKKPIVYQPKLKRRLAHYLDLMKSAQDRKDWARSKRYGEIALKKLSKLSYSPFEEYLLHIRLGRAYSDFAEHSHSVANHHKAYLIAAKNNIGSAYLNHAVYMMGNDFLDMMSIEQALPQFQKVDEYYQKYGWETMPMDKERYFNNFVRLGYCYLLKGNLSMVEEIIDKKLTQLLTSNPTVYNLQNYYNLKGEYFESLGKYDMARQAFQECIQIKGPSKAILFFARTHLATIDISEGKLEPAIRDLKLLLKDSRRVRYNDYVCSINFLLSKCFALKNMPDKARAFEKLVKNGLHKVDVNWFYEMTREFEQLYHKLQPFYRDESRMSDIITHAFRRQYASIGYNIIGQSLPMREIYRLIEKISPTDLPVLIQGETGTGKELVARAIHNNSPRKKHMWLATNCGTLTETLLENELFGHNKGAFTDAKNDKKGYIELVSDGTLFIDEIGDMSSGMQQKLLRVLEEKQVWRLGAEKPISVNTRFIFASNRNIEELVRAKKFREDLYYRINTIVITLPPLRDRKADIPLLINHFLKKYTFPVRHSERSEESLPEISSSALVFLTNYPWPGNVRELENEIKRICALNPHVNQITEEMLSEAIRNPSCKIPVTYIENLSLKGLKEAYEKKIIMETLKKCNGNICEAARLLKYDRGNLYKKVQRFKINTDEHEI